MGIEEDERLLRAASFADVADAYERSRPGYPEEAVRWLTGSRGCDVLDLGAGTGKLTRSLVSLGHRVVAVEPLEQMLAELRRAVPAAEALLGSAEVIPVPDASIDVVTCAQAFHWFDHGRALPEIARVLRSGGRLALIWNMRDESEAWVDELSDAMVGRTRIVGRTAELVEQSGLFEPVEHAVFDHSQEIDRRTLQGLVVSRSYCAILSPDEREPILRKVDAIFDEHARDGILRLPYVTECFRAVKP